MLWLILAVTSYFLTAVVVVVDKFFLSTKVRNPFVYAFYVGILNSAAFLLWPFDFSFLSAQTTITAIIAGVAFFLAIFFLYSAMQRGEVSRVIPVIGGVSPLFVLVLSYLFLAERLPVFWLIASFLLVLGSFLLSFANGRRLSLYSFIAAVFFALTFFAAKLVFIQTSFLNGFVWTRVGTIAGALFLLLVPRFKFGLRQNPLGFSRKLSLFFIGNKSLGAVSFLILNYAIMLGSVTVVNALQGAQYAFIFILALVFSFYCPKFLSESFSLKTTIQKIAGIALVCAGVALLFLT